MMKVRKLPPPAAEPVSLLNRLINCTETEPDIRGEGEERG